jgi:hypothetical protein
MREDLYDYRMLLHMWLFWSLPVLLGERLDKNVFWETTFLTFQTLPGLIIRGRRKLLLHWTPLWHEESSSSLRVSNFEVLRCFEFSVITQFWNQDFFLTLKTPKSQEHSPSSFWNISPHSFFLFFVIFSFLSLLLPLLPLETDLWCIAQTGPRLT